MSLPADSDAGQNAVMCYFPWLPYYLRYQIGFDIVIPPDAQADLSESGQPQRLIHVRLHFPDGFICNPAPFGGMPHPFSATFGGMPHPPSFGTLVPHFFPPNPHFHPPMFPGFLRRISHFQRRVPMGFPGRMMWEEQHEARVIVYVVNGEPGEFMMIDDSPLEIVQQCKNCGEFHREPEHIHNQTSQRAAKRESSEQPKKQPENSRQDPSTSGFTGQKHTSHTSPRKADEHVATDRSQRDPSRASPRKASKRVSRDRKKHLQNEDKAHFAQPMQEEIQIVPPEGTEGGILLEQWENYTSTSVCSQPTPESLAQIMSLLDMDDQKNDENVPNDNTNPGADPNADN